jgi:hypothetical protein
MLEPIAFTKTGDKAIWNNLREVEEIAEQQRRNPLLAALRRLDINDPWCCNAIRKNAKHLLLKDGTKMRIHFCPRCGKEL